MLHVRYKNGDRGQTYNFSRVFGEDTGQEAFFSATSAPMVRQLLRAGTSSVMIAYGVSASGKTHTIEVWRMHCSDSCCSFCLHGTVFAVLCPCTLYQCHDSVPVFCMQGTRADPGVLPQSLHMIFEEVRASAQALSVRVSHYEASPTLFKSRTGVLWAIRCRHTDPVMWF